MARKAAASDVAEMTAPAPVRKMDAALKAEWVKRLRSDRYETIKGLKTNHVFQTIEKKHYFSAFGVLCEILAERKQVEKAEVINPNNTITYLYDGCIEGLPPHKCEQIGVHFHLGLTKPVQGAWTLTSLGEKGWSLRDQSFVVNDQF